MNRTLMFTVLVVFVASLAMPVLASGETFDGNLSGGQLQPIGPCLEIVNSCNSGGATCPGTGPWLKCANDSAFPHGNCLQVEGPCNAWSSEHVCAELWVCATHHWNGSNWVCGNCTFSGFCTMPGCE